MSKAKSKTGPRQQVAIPEHPGLARRGDRIIVRWPAMKGRPSSFRTLTEAQREQNLRRSKLVAPVSTEPFAEYAQRWLKAYTGRTSRPVSPETRESYEYAIGLAVKSEHLGRKPLGKIKPRDVRAFIHELRVQRKLKASSLRRYIAPLRAMFAELVEDDELPKNPASVRIITAAEKRPRKPKVLTPDQTRALVTALPEALRDLVWVLAFTGLRIGEAVALQWRDVDRDEEGKPILWVRRTVTHDKHGRMHVRERAKHRDEVEEADVVPLKPELARLLLARRASSNFAGEADFIFPTRSGSPLGPHNVRRNFRPAAEAAGVPWATPHTLRHSIASLLYEQGWTSHQVAQLVRHADPNFTHRTYIHPTTHGDLSVLDNVLELPE
jgi:integrase